MSIHSLESEMSDTSEQEPESFMAAQRVPTMLQRFTTAASSLLLDPVSPVSSSSLSSDSNDVIGLGHLRTEDDWFGAAQIRRSLTGKSTIPFPNVTSDEEEPVSLAGEDLQDVLPESAPLRRRQSTVVSTIQSISRKLGFWDSEFAGERIQIIVTLISNYLYLLLGFAATLCIYWGAYYHRTSRYKHVPFAVFIGDTQNGQLPPILGELVTQFFQKVPAVHALGHFDIWPYSRLASTALKHNNTLQGEVFHQVHHQKYRGAFFVHENATLHMYQALLTANSSFNPATDLLSAVYETGSDYNGVTNYFLVMIQQIVRGYASFMTKLPWVGYFLETLNSTQIDNVMTNAPQLFTSTPHFQLDDRIPVIEQVVQAPLQIGLIYLCIFTFFQFVFSVPIHMYIASKIKGLRYVMYRILAAQAAYVVLSLSYVLLNTAFQISFTKAFGYLGFLVIWAFAFLTMSAVGSLIEVMVLFCIILKPAMIGVVLLFVAVTNLAPTISPIILCPTFYRYGYAMPVYNSYELMQVAFFNSWKGRMGRNIGILVAWIFVTNAMMPFAMKWMAKQMVKKRQEAAQQEK